MPEQGIPFIGENGFYPRWARGSGKWVFQRTLITVESLGPFAEISASLVPNSDQLIVWVPRSRGILASLNMSALHQERELALNELSSFPLRCYGNECIIPSGPAVRGIVREGGLRPEEWQLFCPSCGGLAGADLACVSTPPIIEKWKEAGRPALDNPGASSLFASAPLVTDLPKWINDSDPSHLELAYLGQQLWPDIGTMLSALGKPSARTWRDP